MSVHPIPIQARLVHLSDPETTGKRLRVGGAIQSSFTISSSSEDGVNRLRQSAGEDEVRFFVRVDGVGEGEEVEQAEGIGPEVATGPFGLTA